MSEQSEITATKKPRVALLVATGLGLGYLPLAPGTWGSLAGLALYFALPLLSYPIFALLLPDASGSFPDDFNRQIYALVSVLTYERALRITGALLIVVVSAVGVWASHRAARYLGKLDPGQIVIDEIGGQLISCAPLFAAGFRHGGWKYVLLGFILFRVFDIWKPWPIRRVEKWPGGWGIMADDWLAGVYAAVVLWMIRWAGWIG